MASRKLLGPSTALYQDGRGSEPMIEVGSMTPADALYMGISSVTRMDAREAGGNPGILFPHSASLHAGYVSYTSVAAAETNEFDGPLPTREHTRRRNVDYIFLH